MHASASSAGTLDEFRKVIQDYEDKVAELAEMP
jgi:hypothetical protein